MPWILYKYILRDLLKLLAISSAVLVVIISFAVAIKPLANGLLGPIMLIKFILYTIPTVLGFALPFAGTFASTLVFSRLALDNEITACRASGLSYIKILTPVFALGLALTISLFFLANFVVPTFYRWAAQTAQADVMRALVSQIDQHRTFVLKDHGIAIYANSASLQQAPTIKDASIQPDKLVKLQGVAAVKLGPNGKHQREVTAQKANVFLFNHQKNSWITMRLLNVQFYDPTRGMFDGGFSRDVALGPFKLPKPFGDNPKFLSWSQLRAISQNPDRYDDVHQRKEALEKALVDDKLVKLITNRLNATHKNRSPSGIILKEQARPARYKITSGKAHRSANKIITLNASEKRPVRIIRHISGKPTRTYKATSGNIRIVSAGFTSQPLIQIEINNVTISDQNKNSKPTHINNLTLPSMIWPNPVTLNTNNLRQAAAASSSFTAKNAAAALNHAIVDITRGITAQLNVRAASSISCLLLLILGAVMATWLVGQMPLVVYMWTFIVAIISILIINTGRHMTSGSEYAVPVALTVMWLGNVLLVFIVGGLYWRLARS